MSRIYFARVMRLIHSVFIIAPTYENGSREAGVWLGRGGRMQKMRAAQRRGQAKGESKQNLGPGRPFPLLLSFCPSSFYRGGEKGPGSNATLYPVWLVLYLVVGSYGLALDELLASEVQSDVPAAFDI